MKSGVKIPFGPKPATLICSVGPSGEGCHAKYNDRFNELRKYERETQIKLGIFYPNTEKDERYNNNYLLINPDKPSGRLVEYEEAIPFDPMNASEFYEKAVDYDTILILGLQFVRDQRIIDYIDRLIFENYAHVELSFPDVDCNRKPIYPHLIARADKVIKYIRPCSKCRRPATLTQRKEKGKPTKYGRDPFDINGDMIFEPVCEIHHELPGAPWEEFLRPVREISKNTSIEIGELLVRTGTMRTGKTWDAIRYIEEICKKKDILYLKPSSDTRDESGFEKTNVSDRAEDKELWIKRKALLFDPRDPVGLYEDERIQNSIGLVFDEAQMLSQEFATVIEALRMGGKYAKPKNVSCAGLGLNFLGELFYIPENGGHRNAVPYLINDARKVRIGFRSCQYPFDMSDHRKKGMCLNRANRDILIHDEKIYADFSTELKTKDLVGEKRYRNTCIAHMPKLKNKSKSLERPIPIRRFNWN